MSLTEITTNKGTKLMTNNTIIVKTKEVYGQTKIYPVCKISQGLTKLLGQKTLTEDNIRTIKNDLGFNIQIEQKQLTF